MNKSMSRCRSRVDGQTTRNLSEATNLTNPSGYSTQVRGEQPLLSDPSPLAFSRIRTSLTLLIIEISSTLRPPQMQSSVMKWPHV